jgi:hypothetical protein
VTFLAAVGPAGRARALADVAAALGSPVDARWIVTADDVEALRAAATAGAADCGRLEAELGGLREQLDRLAGERLAFTGVDPFDELLLEAVAEDLTVRRAAAQAVLTVVDPGAGTSRRDQLQAELARVEGQLADLRSLASQRAVVPADPAGDTAGEVEALESELAALDERWSVLAAQLRDLPEPAASAVDEPVAEARPEPASAEVEMQPDPELAQLAERVASLRSRLASNRGPSVPAWLVEQTVAELEAAKAEVNRLEVEQLGGRISVEDATALEAAHTAAEEAEQKARGRFANPLAKRRAEAARQAEREILDRLNLASYATFVLQHASGAVADPAIAGRLAEARARLDDAESVWETLELHGKPADTEDLSGEEQTVRVDASLLLALEIAEVERLDLAELEAMVRAESVRAARPAGVASAPQPEPAGAPEPAFDPVRARLEAEVADIEARHADVVTQLTVCRERAGASAVVAESEAAARIAELETRITGLEARAETLRGEVLEADAAVAAPLSPHTAAEREAAERELAALDHEDRLLRVEIERLVAIRVSHGIDGPDAEAAAEALEHRMTALAAQIDERGGELQAAERASGRAVDEAVTALLRAQACDAPVVVLDDAFAALAPAVADRLLEVLDEVSATVPVVYLSPREP